jgi:glycosyltransferase involved in cell wall biosynthesis
VLARILLISGSHPPLKDGVGDYCSLLAKWMAERSGMEVHVLTSRGCAKPAGSGAEMHPVIERWDWLGLRSVLREISRIKPDLVHIHYPTLGFNRSLMPNLLPAVLRLLSGPPAVVTLHGFGLYSVLGKIRMLLSCAGSRAVVTVSDHIRRSVSDFAGDMGPFTPLKGKLAEPIYVAPSIRPPGQGSRRRAAALRKSWAVPKGELAIVFFGFINEGKGLDDLLRAAKLCLDSGVGPRITCLSDFNPRQDHFHGRLEALIRELGLASRVSFAGYIPEEDVAGHIMAADVVALPFNYGASTKRTTLLTALSCGMPVITTSDTCLPPIFADGTNVILVPRKNPSMLSRALIRLAGDPVLRKRLGLGARRLARRFVWKDIAGAHLSLYGRVLSGAHAGRTGKDKS